MTGTITVKKTDLLDVIIESIRLNTMESQFNSPLEDLLSEMIQPAGYGSIYDFAQAAAIEEGIYGDNQNITQY